MNRPAAALPALCSAFLLTACGGDGSSSPATESRAGETGVSETAARFTPQEVKAQLERELDLFVDFDPEREDAEVSVLESADESYGIFSIWVFKEGSEAIDFAIGELDVAPPGELAWSEWEALNAELLPGEGSYKVLKNYGNVVLSYWVDAKEGENPTEMPGGFLLIDQALSKLADLPPTTAVEGVNAPEAQVVVMPDPDVDAQAVEETVAAFAENPAWRKKLTAEGKKALQLIERYASDGLPESQIGDAGAALAQLQIEMLLLEQGENPADVLDE